MLAAEARSILGVEPGAGLDEVRTAYRAALRRTHPDLQGGGGEATRQVVDAYRALVAEASVAPPAPPAPPTATTGPGRPEGAVVVDGDTVAAELPAGDLFAMLHEVGDRIGEVTYADAQAGVLEVVVDIAGYGACSVVITLQGRTGAASEASCTVEPLGPGPAPPPAVVAELLAAGLRTVAG